MAGSELTDDATMHALNYQEASYQGNDHQKWGNRANNYLTRHAANHGHFSVAVSTTVW